MSDDSSRSITLKGSDKVVAGGFLVAILAALAAAGYALYISLPILITLASNLIYLGLEVFVLAGIALLFEEALRNRDTVLLKFKLFARNMRKKVVADDPIGAIDVSIETFEKRRDSIDAEAVSADGALKRLQDRIRNREKTGMLDQWERETHLADAAEKLGRPQSEIVLHATNAKRWHDAAATVQPMVDDQIFIKGQLDKAREVAAAALEDLKNQRVVLSAQYDAYTESQKQAKAFKRFFGSSPELQTINFAVEAIEKQTTDAQASIDQLMHQLAPRIAAANLQKEADEQAAMAERAKQKALAAAPEQAALPAAPTTSKVAK